ncbi:hypothetical protein OAN33_03970, partial [Flavobacteriales bacterium]|nr:hypothetical protein [Flavobacteriales bacterium]
MAGVKRLSKVARELNVGISTIVDFLAAQGNEIDGNPNTKIDESVFEVLLAEFDNARSEKLKVDNTRKVNEEKIAAAIIEEESKISETPAKEEEKKPEVLIKAQPVKLAGPSVVGKVVLEEPKKSAKKVEEKSKPKEVKAEPADKVEKVVEKPAQKEVSEPTEPKPVETIKAGIKKLTGPVVLGKIELPVEKKKAPADPSHD